MEGGCSSTDGPKWNNYKMQFMRTEDSLDVNVSLGVCATHLLITFLCKGCRMLKLGLMEGWAK